MTEKFKGYVVRQLFKSNENDFRIYLIELEDGTQVRINGHLPEFSSNFLYDFVGESSVHPKYGLQYKITYFQKSEKQSYLGLIHYLSSDLFTGIGPIRAKRIVDELGDQAIKKILENKEVLRTIGFNPLQTERLYQELYKNQNIEETLVILLGHGLTSNLAMRLYTKYGFNTIDIINENPYQLISDVVGIGFKRADEIAFKIGIEKDDPRRVEAAIIFVLNEYIKSSGNTYLDEKMLFEVINKELLKQIDNEVIQNAITKLIDNNLLVKDDVRYSLKDVKEAELNIAKELFRFIGNEATSNNLDNEIQTVEKRFNITYTKQQKEAITKAMNNQITIITGGPGTGKTTVLLGLLEVYAYTYGLDLHSSSIVEKIALCAPTGRAARRMSEIMDIGAFTIHRLLGYDHSGEFLYNKTHQLPQDLIIIDEASMIDIYLADQLFNSIGSNTKVIIVGDKDQLPSVGPGQVLGDLILSEKIPVVYLDEIHRQGKNSSIITLANDINMQKVSRNYESTEDLTLINISQQDIITHLKEITKQALDSGYDLIEDIQILIPIYRGPVGIDAVNDIFQKHFLKEDTPYMNIGTTHFYEGDKVIHQINNPSKGVMNGDVGYVKQIYSTKDNNKIMEVDYFDKLVTYDQNELDEIKLAYAISVHKSQGSEYKIVIIPLVSSYSFSLRKELLYTGVTRAKSNLFLIGDLSLIERASKRLNQKRNTNLSKYLNEILEKEELTPFDFL